MCSAASAQDVKASAAWGLWARWMVRMPLAAGGRLERVGMERVERVLMVGVLGAAAAALGRFIPEEIPERLFCLDAVAVRLIGAGSQHEGEQVRRGVAHDRVGLRQRAGGVTACQVEHADVIAGVVVERRQLAEGLERPRQEALD